MALGFQFGGSGGGGSVWNATPHPAYAAGGYTLEDVARMQREQLMRDQKDMASFQAYLNAVAAGAPQTTLAQINPSLHYERTGKRYLPQGDEMIDVEEPSFEQAAARGRQQSRWRVQEGGLAQMLQELGLKQKAATKQEYEMDQMTPMERALKSLNPEDAYRGVMMGLKVPEFFGSGDIPGKYEQERLLREMDLQKLAETMKLNYAKLAEQGGYHRGLLDLGAERNALGGQGLDTKVFLEALRQAVGLVNNPFGAMTGQGNQGLNDELTATIIQALSSRNAARPGAKGDASGGGGWGGGQKLEEAYKSITQDLNTKHGNAVTGSTTSVKLGGMDVQFIKSPSGWKVVR